jgi:hypothetical protein
MLVSLAGVGTGIVSPLGCVTVACALAENSTQAAGITKRLSKLMW